MDTDEQNLGELDIIYVGNPFNESDQEQQFSNLLLCDPLIDTSQPMHANANESQKKISNIQEKSQVQKLNQTQDLQRQEDHQKQMSSTTYSFYLIFDNKLATLNLQDVVIKTNIQNQLSGNKFIETLSNQFQNFDIDNYFIFLKDPLKDQLIQLEKNILEQIVIDLTTFYQFNKSIYIELLCKNQDFFKIKLRLKREKEKTIEFAQSQVERWRNTCLEKSVNLDQAASLIFMSRKTLNNYSFLIKAAKANNFDFDLHKSQRISKLKSFLGLETIKKQKQQKQSISSNENEN